MKIADFPEDVHNSLVVLDCGTSKIRAGFAGQQKPLFTIPTVVCKSTIDAATTKIVGAAAFRGGMSDKITYPMERGFIKNWHDMEDIFEYIFEHDMRIKPKMHQMLITEPFNNTLTNREKTAEMMFEKFEFNCFFLAPSTPMGMYGYGCTTGVMVESGAGQTHILAFKNGDYIPDSYRHIPLGGNDLSKYMGQLLTRNGNSKYFHGKRNELEILNDIKRIGCHVVLNYDDAIQNAQKNPNYIVDNVVLHDGNMVSMITGAFQVPELLFKPEMIGIKTGGIAKNIFECIQACPTDIHSELYKNICLCGGNTMFDGIKDRLVWEVRTFAGPNVKVSVNASPERDNVIFLGSSLLGVATRMPDYLISYQEYKEYGNQILQMKKF